VSKPEAKLKLEPEKKGFQRSQLTNVVEVKLKMPLLYPSTIEQPFTLYMRLQLVKEAEEAQSRFLMLSSDEADAATHEYDAHIISLLSVKAPEGFSDFPSVGDDPQSLQKAIYDYFLFIEGSVEEREAMAHICRHLVSRYRRTTTPSDYL